MGWFWYQTSISVQPVISSTWHRFLQFESANYLALVWIQPIGTTNGSEPIANLLGAHVGGHLPFILNATEVMQSSGSEHFRLTVAISNQLTRDTIPSGRMVDLSHQVGRQYLKFRPDFDFFHFAGLMGSVNLLDLPPAHIAHVDFAGYEDNETTITFNVCLSQQATGVRFELRGSLRSPEGAYIAEGVKRDRNSSLYYSFAFRLEELAPETLAASRFADPLMAQFVLESTTNEAGPIWRDKYELKFYPNHPGHIFTTTRRNLVGNGTNVQQLQGFGMHHEQAFSGRTMSLAAIMKDIYLLKQVGANVIRTSHYPYSPEFLDACDESGILVVAECPAVGLGSFSGIKLLLHKQILLEMMQRDHQHPSIIMWSVANEPQSQLAEAKEYFESLLEYARNELAPYTVRANRPLTAAIAQSCEDDQVGQTLDVIMVNKYYGWYEFTATIEAIRLPLIESLTNWSQKHPGKPLIVSEFGADTVAGLHGSTTELFSEEFQRDLIAEHERVFDEIVAKRRENHINLLGSMIWNFADFSTHDSLMRVGGNRKGIFTRDRRPKLAVERVREIYLARSRLATPSKGNR